MALELEDLRRYMLAKPGAYEDFPFGPENMVFKVAGKMFSLIAIQAKPLHVSLKCDPLHAEHLRAAYPAVQLPSYLDKRHWNKVIIDGTIADETIRALIDESYSLVYKGLTRAARRAIEGDS
jgi:predicted DNA-binding protein (MmcQ/YjbR family)